MSKQTFAERCQLAQQLLPDAQYRAMLTALHAEMLAALAEQPAQRCVCGEPETSGTHRADGPCYAEQPAQQEPVALPCCGYTDASAVKWNPYNQVVQCHNCGQVYTTPQPPAQPLTDEQVDRIADQHPAYLGSVYPHAFARAIEAAHGITKGNT